MLSIEHVEERALSFSTILAAGSVILKAESLSTIRSLVNLCRIFFRLMTLFPGFLVKKLARNGTFSFALRIGSSYFASRHSVFPRFRELSPWGWGGMPQVLALFKKEEKLPSALDLFLGRGGSRQFSRTGC